MLVEFLLIERCSNPDESPKHDPTKFILKNKIKYIMKILLDAGKFDLHFFQITLLCFIF
jgi:hypothetical protein